MSTIIITEFPFCIIIIFRKSPRGGEREKIYSSSDSSSQQQKSDSSSSRLVTIQGQASCQKKGEKRRGRQFFITNSSFSVHFRNLSSFAKGL